VARAADAAPSAWARPADCSHLSLERRYSSLFRSRLSNQKAFWRQPPLLPAWISCPPVRQLAGAYWTRRSGRRGSCARRCRRRDTRPRSAPARLAPPVPRNDCHMARVKSRLRAVCPWALNCGSAGDPVVNMQCQKRWKRGCSCEDGHRATCTAKKPGFLYPIIDAVRRTASFNTASSAADHSIGCNENRTSFLPVLALQLSVGISQERPFSKVSCTFAKFAKIEYLLTST
jgi:hypothetical protein